jgi:hypothetical protein
MILLRKGVYHYRAMCHTCHAEGITDPPIDRYCPNCGDMMVVFALQKPLKMAFVEAYDYKSNQKKGGEE